MGEGGVTDFSNIYGRKRGSIRLLCSPDTALITMSGGIDFSVDMVILVGYFVSVISRSYIKPKC